MSAGSATRGASHNQIAERIAGATAFGPITIGATRQGSTAAAAMDIAADLLGNAVFLGYSELLNLLEGGSDRPVGLRSSMANDITFPNTVVVLTREIVEAALNGPHAPVMPSPIPGRLLNIPKPGIMFINFTDSGSSGIGGSSNLGPGSYTMVVQVERL